MIDNRKNDISKGGGNMILLHSSRRGLSLVLCSVTEEGGRFWKKSELVLCNG